MRQQVGATTQYVLDAFVAVLVDVLCRDLLVGHVRRVHRNNKTERLGHLTVISILVADESDRNIRFMFGTPLFDANSLITPTVGGPVFGRQMSIKRVVSVPKLKAVPTSWRRPFVPGEFLGIVL